MYRLIIVLSAIFIINGCKSSKPCINPFSEKIVDLIEGQAKVSTFFKKSQIDNKTRVVDNLCSHFKSNERILIVDFPIPGDNGYYGAVFFYNEDLTFSFQQKEKKFRIKEGYDFDSNRGLERIILAIKDSTIQKLSAMESSKSHLVDSKSMNIFYLDASSKTYKFYKLFWDQILPIRRAD